MEEEKKIEETKPEDQPIRLKKKRRWPYVLLVLLVLLLASGYLAYSKGYLDTTLKSLGLENLIHSEEIDEKIPEEEEIETIIVSQTEEEQEYPDPYRINGKWKSDVNEEGHFLEFEIAYPEVINFNDLIGVITALEESEYEYVITFSDSSGTMKLYISDLSDTEATVWYAGEDGQYSNSLTLRRENSDVIAHNEQETPFSGSGSSNSGSGSSSGSSSSQTGKKGHWETRTETIPAWDEQVLVSEGYYERVLVYAAWDEEETYCLAFGKDVVEVQICNQCGAVFYSRGDANKHIENSETCGGYHNDYIEVGEAHCKEYGTDIIHHDAVYEQVWHDAVYKTVHHEETTRTYQVWVED